MEYNIRKGVINQSKHLTSSPVYENFSDIFKKLLVKYKIPFRDITCPELFNVSTVRFNNITNKLEILVDAENHVFSPLNTVFDKGIRYNTSSKSFEYFDIQSQQWKNVNYFVTEVTGTVSWQSVLDKPTFSTVAFSNNYSDLSNKPDLSLKVDKVVGKQLSTEDFTTQQKNKLAVLEPLVFIDWTSTSGYSQILNKPTKLSDFINDTQFIKLSDIPPYTLPTASSTMLGGIKIGNNLTIDSNGVVSATSSPQVNSNWTSNSGVSQILNKPTKLSDFTNDLVINKTTVGLGNVDNTSDLNKPVSTATQTVLNQKVNSSDLAIVATTGSYNDLSDKPIIPTIPVISVNNKTGSVVINKADVGLSNVDNTSDNTKNVLSATKLTTGRKINTVTFDGTSDITINMDNIPDGTVNKTFTSTEKTKLSGIAANANNYSHPNHTGDVTSTGDGATVISNNVVSNTKLATMPSNTIKGNVTGSATNPTDLTNTQVKTFLSLSKSDVELSNVDNTSDLSKPISTATQSALNAKQDTLFSGTNIKTINNNSILGGGNLNIPFGINLTDLSATSPIQYDNVTGVMSIPAASTSTDGYLSTADWNSFNDKENKQTLTFINATTSTTAATVAKVATVNGSYVPQSGDLILLTLTQSNTASNPTLNIDGSGNKSILLGNQNPSNIAMLGTKVLLWYDGAAYQLFGSQRNIDTDTNTTYTGWGFTPTAITANTTGTVNRAYIANSASRIILTLPATFAIGDVIGITGLGTGGFQVKTSSADNILFNENNISSTGYINGGQYDTLYVMCIVANTTWKVVSYNGSLIDNLGNIYTNVNVPITGGASTIITNNLTNDRALISNSSGKVDISDVTNTELSYLSGATSAIQTQINNKLNSSSVSLSAGQVGFGSGSNTIGGDNGLYWDNTNKRFAVGTTTPTEKLHVVGNGLFTGTLKIGAYTLPNTDGTANQMLRTNGSGVVSWQNSYPIEVINSSNLFSRGLSGTGSGVTSTDYSNFFGADAGNSATNASNSNFFGFYAGGSATNASNSNFFGFYAGGSATNASNSNFFGFYAGGSATGANGSNFFGFYAGLDATNASYSNFLGFYAGGSATGANGSNFFGFYAGGSATNASYSNFLGFYAGRSATNANGSNFFGSYAGASATNAAYSNFFGADAGNFATDAAYSNLFGYKAGKTFTGNNIGSNNIIIGTNISLGDAVANSMNIGGVLFGTGFNSDTSGDPNIAPVAGGKVGVGEVAPKEKLEVDGVVLSRFKTMSADPTTSDIASGYFMAVKNTSTGKLHLWANDGGTMKKIEFT